MRTTLAIDDDVLMTAKTLAQREQSTVGEVLSRLARQALRSDASAEALRNGIRLLPTRADAAPVTMALVDQLRDELPG